MRAAVYTRVSSNEQAEGYSLRQQREAVETYCKEQGWEVVEFIEDVDSGAYLERRGLDKVRDLVDLGEIDLVVAQDVDRFARDDGIIVALLKREFSRKGARLYALNQRSDGSAAGDLADKIISAVASYERSLIAQRTSRGRLQKAREGKVPNTRNFGFDCVDGRYVVNGDMEAVRYIFHEAANHQSLRSIEQELAERGVKAPRGGRLWRESIRKFIFYDVYKPHTFDELSEIVSPAVLGTLNKDKSYGVLWWNCKHKEYDRDTNRRMRLVKTEVKPKSEWVAVPVPDSGIPREVVEKARANIKDNTWKSSKRNDRFWQLSGGVGKCGECGRNLVPAARNKRNFYYHCRNENCANNKYRRAQDLEEKGIEVLRDLMSKRSMIKARIDRIFEEQKNRIGKPTKDFNYLNKRLIKLKDQRDKLLDLYLDGSFDMDIIKHKDNTINEEIQACERDLEKLSEASKSLDQIISRKQMVLSLLNLGYKDDKGFFYRNPPNSDDQSEEGAKRRQKEVATRRQRLYKDLGIKVFATREDSWVEIGGSTLYQNGNSS